ncbi:MAG: hypothetical protein HYX50_00870 [Chloroflexi bacterium]|nr:hypothetical protein [Chloroflexota bacterium]
MACLSNAATALLQRVHRGECVTAAREADELLRTLRQLVRATGATLDDLPAWQANITGWRALARLAAPVVTAQAG